MARLAPDDLDLLATRLRLGIPLEGFDGRPIPLRHLDHSEVEPVEAALILLASGAELLPGDDGSSGYVARMIERAYAVEAASIMASEAPATTAAKVVAVLVSGAVRATVLARHADASPSDLNRATLAWYDVQTLRHRQMLDASEMTDEARLTA